MDQVQMPLFNRCILALRLAWRDAGEACEFGLRGGTGGRANTVAMWYVRAVRSSTPFPPV